MCGEVQAQRDACDCGLWPFSHLSALREQKRASGLREHEGRMVCFLTDDTSAQEATRTREHDAAYICLCRNRGRAFCLFLYVTSQIGREQCFSPPPSLAPFCPSPRSYWRSNARLQRAPTWDSCNAILHVSASPLSIRQLLFNSSQHWKAASC